MHIGFALQYKVMFLEFTLYWKTGSTWWSVDGPNNRKTILNCKWMAECTYEILHINTYQKQMHKSMHHIFHERTSKCAGMCIRYLRQWHWGTRCLWRFTKVYEMLDDQEKIRNMTLLLVVVLSTLSSFVYLLSMIDARLRGAILHATVWQPSLRFYISLSTNCLRVFTCRFSSIVSADSTCRSPSNVFRVCTCPSRSTFFATPPYRST
jgi:hypothetical protein